MAEFFAQYRDLIIFAHIISAVIWVGGMIATRFATHYALASLEGPIKLERTAQVLKNLFTIVFPFVILLIVTALIMAIAMDLHHGADKVIVMIKESIWTVMTINLLVMMMRLAKARKYISVQDFSEAKKQLSPIGSFMVPLNIVLGIVAIYLGVTLS